MKLFTKSRFKICLDCPTKLYYQDREGLYDNSKKEDRFLEALAEGGYQVGALAKLYYPGGHDIIDRGYDVPIGKTNELLKQKDVVIFEAAIKYKNFFIRVDILEKNGNDINLIEVKSKSFDGDVPNYQLKTKTTDANVQDVAFQTFVMQKAFPQWNLNSFLMYADKSKTASVNGLNQFFRLNKDSEGLTNVVLNKEMIKMHGIGNPVLSKINVNDIVYKIINESEGEKSFDEKLNKWADLYTKGQKIENELSYNCFGCEFRSNNLAKSGFKECWSKHYNWTDSDYRKPLISEIWDNRRKKLMFESQIFFLDHVEKEHLGDIGAPQTKLSRIERQWLQIEKTKVNDKTPYIEKDGLKSQMQQFTYPLHFIDFETCMVAIPFYKGQKPYEQIAFQFSHHIMLENGKIEHKNEFIEIERGVFPNFNFVRALKKALENDNGTIFRYAAHENTVLNQILQQISASSENELPDKNELEEFIISITNDGPRTMIDMLELVKKFYYHPKMKGSNSIKAVLPAVMETDFVRNKYSKPVSTINITTKNFSNEMIWFKIDDKEDIVDPYKLLNPVFNDIINSEDLIDHETISDGGAAMTAFARMQFAEMPDDQRNSIINALKKYCELDTLAMVIIYDYWRNL